MSSLRETENAGSLGRAGEEDGGDGVKCLIKNLEVNYPCSTACPLYGYCMAAFLEARKQQIRTNADRIRAMSDEELATFIVDKSPGMFSCNGRCLYWLRQPAEED